MYRPDYPNKMSTRSSKPICSTCQKYSFKHAALIGGQDVVLSDGASIFILQISNKLTKLALDEKLEILDLKTTDKHILVYTKEKLYVLDAGVFAYDIARRRFNPRIVYDINIKQ